MAKVNFRFGIEQATVVRGISAFKGLHPIPEGTLNRRGDPITDIEWVQTKIKEYIQQQIVRWESSEAQKAIVITSPDDTDFEVLVENR